MGDRIQKIVLQILLAPFALLFGIGVSIKDSLYAIGFLKGVSFSVPVINVGNLSVGGSGKTPHVEHLVRLLKDYLHVAILSRGYRRKTRGFFLARPGHTVDTVGDEPLQYARKYPEVTVAVSESRALGVPKLLQARPQTQVILLDDAFQHRAIEPGLNILLSDYKHLFTRDFLLPVGRLREWRSAYKRADLILVTKCPLDLSEEKKKQLIQEIQPLPYQQVFFTAYLYHRPYALFDRRAGFVLNPSVQVLLVCAIAKTEYLVDYLEENVESVKMLQFEDHHDFNRYDLEQIKKYYIHMPGSQKVILTTEKDATRLEKHRDFLAEHQLPVFVLPIEVHFLFEEGITFRDVIRKYLLEFRI